MRISAGGEQLSNCDTPRRLGELKTDRQTKNGGTAAVSASVDAPQSTVHGKHPDTHKKVSLWVSYRFSDVQKEKPSVLYKGISRETKRWSISLSSARFV